MNGRGKDPAPRGRSFLRSVLCVLFFLGPLAIVEGLARRSTELLVPHMRDNAVAGDTKRMLVGLGCPDVLALGTSQTDRSLVGAFLLGKEIGEGRAIERPFDFAAPAERATNMYMMWRSVHASGCDPEYVFIEVSPAALNSAHGGTLHDAPFLDLETMLAMPAGFTAARGYDTTELLELATYERLFILRRRAEIQSALIEWSGSTAVGSDRAAAPLPTDGKLGAVLTKPLSKTGGYELERDTRMRDFLEGDYVWKFGDVERAALLQLIDEAQAAGSRVILQTPPVTDIYRDVIEQLDLNGDWCAFVHELSQRSDIEWFNEYSATDYDHDRFHDWVHLSPRGARRYINRLLTAVRTRSYSADPHCP